MFLTMEGGGVVDVIVLFGFFYIPSKVLGGIGFLVVGGSIVVSANRSFEFVLGGVFVIERAGRGELTVHDLLY